ncbi:MAG TPA: hypothetical protein DIS75_01680 [Chryseobacterium sp.]|nr:hypothetical protein [Chryseobacterium sp.]
MIPFALSAINFFGEKAITLVFLIERESCAKENDEKMSVEIMSSFFMIANFKVDNAKLSLDFHQKNDSNQDFKIY